jgi:type II restriction/modification system DNA methylase subunit YeeA
MVTLVETMLNLHEQKAASPSPALEQQIAETDKAIDTLVYQLYDLTLEEIAIVEGSAK